MDFLFGQASFESVWKANVMCLFNRHPSVRRYTWLSVPDCSFQSINNETDRDVNRDIPSQSEA